MTLRNWIMENIIDFNIQIKTEEDLKVKAIIPYLKELGYNESEFRFENPIPVVIGSKKTTVYSDIEILINGKVEVVIDVKKPSNSITEKDILQSTSYAKLISTPSALYSVTTNGIDCVVSNTIYGNRDTKIPTKAQLLRDIDRTKKRTYTEVELREIKSVLLTLLEPNELYKVINRSKEVIEKKGLIRSDQSFREMTKILLVKMNEERRVKANEGTNRFSLEYLELNARTNNATEIEVFRNLFNDAKNKYPNIYTNQEETLYITDNDCLIDVVKNIEPFSFLGTGDDIKGAVYEIFLKSTLRGDFDQYFTPREIVDFIVKFANPEPGDIFLDPACGSGGFLIQAFNYVNQKIINAPDSEVEAKKKFSDLVEKSIWGHEADYDLHVLAKINLIMHGDGWNNIHQGDTLSTNNLPNNFFDLILTNPPFTIKYDFPNTLSKYELGLGKDKEELDILFVEKSLQVLKPGGDLFIVLPEGLLNNKVYKYFRSWLMENTYLLCSISLPEGAFIPFGGSVSKTCILGIRKKDKENPEFNKPNNVFLGRAIEVGYETGKKVYRKKDENDLSFFLNQSSEVFDGIRISDHDGECAWIKQELINDYRMDASYLLNLADREKLHQDFQNLVPLGSVADIENISLNIEDSNEYFYLEVPDISADTGTVSNIRQVYGRDLKASSLHVFYPDDILFTRINPRISRVTIAPPINKFGVMSKEIYRIIYKENEYIKAQNKFVLLSILQAEHVQNQIIRLATGSSSSRARVQINDLLNDVFIPIPSEEIQSKISKSNYDLMLSYWNMSQEYLDVFVNNQTLLGSQKFQKKLIRSI